ncbi:hypothetical protein DBR32_10115 [Taibaiella sp. KBW10]|uniref:hypothetical protein n=1 Tax=Taibaiella sp. KBW10 TaxID=2153357 RepID=UPI000F59B9A4|nr:hypothetical protein [Taibaiella sp. KBW10]RQO31052.1 hypothetical protein DBR32_10115 [Taibaiella sp. KBW10]
MKLRLTLLMLLLNILAFGQNKEVNALNNYYLNAIGIGIGFSSINSIQMDLKVSKKRGAFYFSFTNELGTTKGKYVKKILSNYGQTLINSGIDRESYSIGYSRHLNKALSVSGEITYGINYGYKNYSDDNFSGGGYHVLNKEKDLLGFGLRLNYRPIQYLEISGGFNTISKANFTILYYPFVYSK